jgi:hypothetical protein
MINGKSTILKWQNVRECVTGIKLNYNNSTRLLIKIFTNVY